MSPRGGSIFYFDFEAFIQWVRVAAEVVRISAVPMDVEIVWITVDEEDDRANG